MNILGVIFAVWLFFYIITHPKVLVATLIVLGLGSVVSLLVRFSPVLLS